MGDLQSSDFITSKEASEITGYSQDYIGQLARSGRVEARRIGGLWHLGRESLMSHKTKADSYVPVPPRKSASDNEDSSVVVVEGEDFISTAEAASLTGYHVDYVGQLAREAAVSARNISGRWFVSKEELLGHKREKDTLLAEVQVNAVGLSHRSSQGSDVSANRASEPYFTYSDDVRPLMPEGAIRPVNTSDVGVSDDLPTDQSDLDMDLNEDESEARRLPIRVFQSPVASGSSYEVPKMKSGHASSYYLVGLALTILVLLVAAGVYVYFTAGSSDLIYIRPR